MKKTEKIVNALSNPKIQNAVGVVLIVSLLAFHILFIRANLVTTFDDAYMFIRYANNALAGHGIAWNPDGTQTYGATSLLYLFVIVFLKWVFPTAEGSSILTITSASFGILFLIILAIGCARLSGSTFLKRSSILFTLLLAIVFLPSPGFLFHTISGMDTSLSLLCNAFLIFATLDWTKRKNKWAVFLVILSAYLAFLARPDNLIYSLVFPPLCMILSNDDDRARKAAIFLGGLGALLILDTAIKYMIFGDPLPLPFYAKTDGYDDGYAGGFRWNPIAYLVVFFQTTFLFMSILVFTASRKIKRELFFFFLPVAITFTYYFSVVQIMGYQARYYFPAIPFFVIASHLSLDRALQEREITESHKNNFKQPIRLVLFFACAVLLWTPSIKTSIGQSFQTAFLPKAKVFQSTVSFSTESTNPKIGWWQSINAITEISVQLPQGTKFAMSEYGLVGAKASQIDIIDPLGLHDPFFAHHGFSIREFFNRQPDIIWFPHPDYTKIISSIQSDPEFWKSYDYYPYAFDYGLAIRRESKNYIIVNEIIKKEWELNYPSVDIDKSIAKIK